MKKILVFVMFVMLGTACGPYKASPSAKPLQQTERVVLLDSVLKKLKVVQVAGTKSNEGRLQVQLQMENKKNKDLWTDVQVVFHDDQGVELERSSWEAFMWHRRSVSSYQRTSLSNKASDYRVLIRAVK